MNSGPVLITGATGFTGSFLVEYYALTGRPVIGTYRDPARDRSWAPPGVEFRQVDLAERRAVFDLVSGVRPATVIHLAAQSSVSASWMDPVDTLVSNAAPQHHLLEAIAALHPAARVLVVGSSDEYGDGGGDGAPIHESSELNPLNPYALSKVVQDLMGRQFAIVGGLDIVRARPFLQIGPRRSATFVTGSFARQVAEIAAGHHPPVIEVGNLDLARDFTDVRDVAEALAVLAEQGRRCEVYNVASGTARSLRSILDIMMETAGVRAEVRAVPRLMRSNEPAVLVGDISKIRDEVGWSPSIPFEQSVADTVNYWRGVVERQLVGQGEEV